MTRTYHYRLHPNAKQEVVLLSWLRSCQQLHNAALEQRRDAYRKQRKNIYMFDQAKQLAELRQSDDAWGNVPSDVLRSSLTRLDRSYKAFFRRIKDGGKPGFPRFKSKHRYRSFSFDYVKVTKSRVHIPKLGHVKFSLYRPIEGEILNCRVKLDLAGKWWVHFCCYLGEAPAKNPVKSIVGVDVGINTYAVLSDGSSVENPRFFRKAEEKLAARQQSFSRKRRGSASRKTAKKLVAKAYAEISNQRLDHARKLTVELFKKHDAVVYEDLNIKGMTQDSSLSKSINDAAWGQFIGCLISKAEKAGKWAISVDPRGTSQRCSGCGETVKKALACRVHECPACGLVLDRDHNAALNVLRLGYSRVDVHTEA